MTDLAASRSVPGVEGSRTAVRDARRWLQLALAALWALDGVLQYQPFMFTPTFATQVITPTAQGNPAIIADPIMWAAGIMAHQPVLTNAVFATIQLLVGLGIAWRPTVKTALAGSIVWAVAVWWFGEGLGGVLSGSANPLSGAPGAVIIYALLAVLLWPTTNRPSTPPSRPGPSASWSWVAARPVGATTARVLWLVLWGSLAYFAVAPANRAPQAWHDMISQMASGQPRWLATIDTYTASLLAHHGLVASIVLAVVLGAIAVGIFLPIPATRVVLVAAVVVAALIWVIGEALGGVFSGQGTDPNSGPLLALLAVAYWPVRADTQHLPDAATTDAMAVESLSVYDSDSKICW